MTDASNPLPTAERDAAAAIEHILREWEETQAGVPVAAAVVRGMAAEIRRVTSPARGRA